VLGRKAPAPAKEFLVAAALAVQKRKTETIFIQCGEKLFMRNCTSIILFYFILFYFILFYFILFYFILFYFILFYFILFYFVLFYFTLFCFALFYLLSSSILSYLFLKPAALGKVEEAVGGEEPFFEFAEVLHGRKCFYYFDCVD
jgi:hypothetical protein